MGEKSACTRITKERILHMRTKRVKKAPRCGHKPARGRVMVDQEE